VLAKCVVSGTGAYGCAYSAASATAYAHALYDAWITAYAGADTLKNECKCLTDAVAVAYADVAAWGELTASVNIWLDAGVCLRQAGEISVSKVTDCWSKATLNLWWKAVAKASLETSCTTPELVECKNECQPAYDYTSKVPNAYQNCYDSCVEKSKAEAFAYAEAQLKVTATDVNAGCTSTSKKYVSPYLIADHFDNWLSEEIPEANITVNSPLGKRISTCVANATGSSYAEAANGIAYAFAKVLKNRCTGVTEYTKPDDSDSAVAKAVAEVRFCVCDTALPAVHMS
jgi:hypothetical protein